jgi:peroxiredoxin
MSLAADLEALTRRLTENKSIPQSALEIMFGQIQDLVKSGQADRAVMAGQAAPTFRLKDTHGKTFDSLQALGRGPLVATFFRGVWCAYCNLELRALEAARPEIEARGATVVALSMQAVEHSEESRSTNQLGFPVLLDPGGDIADRFGLRSKIPANLAEVFRMGGTDLETINGEDSWTLPIPALYVIGEDSIVAYAEINPDFTKRAEPSDVFPVLDKLRSSRSWRI